MSATATSANPQQHSPAQVVLERFLTDALAVDIDGSANRQAEIDLRTDILYVLSDNVAHRRAQPFKRLVEEVRKLQIPELMPSLPGAEQITNCLRVLLEERLVREFPSPSDKHYELAHDFLVRHVVRSYRDLERRRISEFAVLKQRREVADAELSDVSRMRRGVSVAACALPVLTFALTMGLIVFAVRERLPNGIGISYLWFLACPAAALLLLGMIARRGSAILLAVLTLAMCGGTWLYEYSLPTVDVGSVHRFDTTASSFCGALAYDVGRELQVQEISLLMRSCESAYHSYGASAIYNADYSNGIGGDLCFDLGRLFAGFSYSATSPQGGQVQRYYATQGAGQFRALCDKNRTEWASYVKQAAGISRTTGFSLRPYQLNRLEFEVAFFAAALVFLHILIFPAILLAMLRVRAVTNMAIRRVWSEVIDVLLALTAAFVLGTASVSLRRDWMIGVGCGLGLVAYAIISTITLTMRQATPGGLLTRVAVRRQGFWAVSFMQGRPQLGRLAARQAIVAVWSGLNVFAGIPSLIVTPLYVGLSRKHQLFYDDLLKLATEPGRKRGLKRASVLHASEFEQKKMPEDFSEELQKSSVPHMPNVQSAAQGSESSNSSAVMSR